MVVYELLKEAFSLIILSTFVSLYVFCRCWGSSLNLFKTFQGFVTYLPFSLVSIMNRKETEGGVPKEREKIKGNESENILLRLPIYYIIDWEYNKIWYDIPRHIFNGRERRFDEPCRMLFQNERYKHADSFFIIKLFKVNVKHNIFSLFCILWIFQYIQKTNFNKK